MQASGERCQEFFKYAAKDIAMRGYSASTIPTHLKQWCADELFNKLPQNVVKELFVKLVTQPDELMSCSLSFQQDKSNNNSGKFT